MPGGLVESITGAKGSTPTVIYQSVDERIREPRRELDEVGLPGHACLGKDAVQMRLRRRFRDTQRSRRLRNTADLHDRQEHAELGRREIEGPRDQQAVMAALSVSPSERLFLGGLRNLLSGATAVGVTTTSAP